MGMLQGSASWRGGCAACWVLTHLMCTPREAELHPPALKWVTHSSHPLQPGCAAASAVPAPREAHHGALMDITGFQPTCDSRRRPRNTLKTPAETSLLFLALTSSCKQAGSCVWLPALAAMPPQLAHGRCLSHREAVPPLQGQAQLPLPLTALLAAAQEIPAAASHRPPHARSWSRPKAVTSALPCHSKGCARVPARTLLLPSTCSWYSQVWQRLLSSSPCWLGAEL